MDGTYEVLAANRGIQALLEGVAGAADPAAERDADHPAPGGPGPAHPQLREWRGHLLDQMERQLALLRSAPLRELYDEVAAYPLPEPGGRESAARGAPRPASRCR